MKTLMIMVLAGLFSVSMWAQPQLKGSQQEEGRLGLYSGEPFKMTYVLKDRQQEEGRLSPQQKERIESMRVAFITLKLELSSSQAEKFWPVYNEYNAKKENLRNEAHEISELEIMEIPEDRARELLATTIKYREAELELDKQLYRQLGGVLSSNQILALSRVDGQFRRHMVRQARSVSGSERRVMEKRQQHQRMQRQSPDRRERNN